ncbi:hypothetical protein K7W42_03290 [Deinococcus sp. HMF7604]|uniref:hypothetical protein n=1 Tax=Deinococcus betulae TaxID=2873312 RepID=UPI001CC9D605|nr:hypothetical protein [Deinococcus betulae]MBZ9749883.1 hypothetical protein [Deinococcus betulae]
MPSLTRIAALIAFSALALSLNGQAAPSSPLSTCSGPISELLSCKYPLKAFGGRVLPRILPNTVPYEKRVMRLTGGLLRLNTTAREPNTGTYSLEWNWMDNEKNLKKTANDVGNFVITAAGQLTFTSMGGTVYKGTLKGGQVAVTGVPLVTDNFSGRAALTFSGK